MNKNARIDDSDQTAPPRDDEIPPPADADATTLTFALADDVVLEREGRGYRLWLRGRPFETPMRIPDRFAPAVDKLRGGPVPVSAFDGLFTSRASLADLAAALGVATALREGGFLSLTLSQRGTVLARCLPAPPPSPKDVAADSACRLSRFAFLRGTGGHLRLESAATAYCIELPERRAVALVAALADGGNAARLAASVPGLDAGPARRLLALFRATGMLAAGGGMEDRPPAATWEFHDRLMHTRSRAGLHRAPAGPTYRFRKRLPALPLDPAGEETSEGAPAIALPRPPRDDPATEPGFYGVLAARRSIRDFSDAPLTVGEIGALLHRAARLQHTAIDPDNLEIGWRASPSAGGLQEITLYPAIRRCDFIPDGLYRYDARKHRLLPLPGGEGHVDQLQRLAAEAMRRNGGGAPPAMLLLLTARMQRIAWTYESIAYATTLKNVGCLYQTLYLVATAMGLAPCALADGNADLFARASRTDPVAEPLVGEFAIGKPRRPPAPPG